jgi:glucose-1-phosphate cytidylyltransferase
LCEKYVTDDFFMLTYGDAVSNIDITRLVAFHRKHGKIGTVTGVFPPSRFGDLTVSRDLVRKFKEKPKLIQGQNPINGGFFVFRKEFFSMIPADPSCDLEKDPLEKLAAKGELTVYRHSGFWQCMDTYRDYILLNKLWSAGPEWKVW